MKPSEACCAFWVLDATFGDQHAQRLRGPACRSGVFAAQFCSVLRLCLCPPQIATRSLCLQQTCPCCFLCRRCATKAAVCHAAPEPFPCPCSSRRSPLWDQEDLYQREVGAGCWVLNTTWGGCVLGWPRRCLPPHPLHGWFCLEFVVQTLLQVCTVGTLTNSPAWLGSTRRISLPHPTLCHNLCHAQGCTALSVVSMPFYWPPRAGTM